LTLTVFAAGHSSQRGGRWGQAWSLSSLQHHQHGNSLVCCQPLQITARPHEDEPYFRTPMVLAPCDCPCLCGQHEIEKFPFFFSTQFAVWPDELWTMCSHARPASPLDVLIETNPHRDGGMGLVKDQTLFWLPNSCKELGCMQHPGLACSMAPL
jgi:hypothetical protein